LVWQDDPRRRPVDDPLAHAGDTVSFQDDFPVTVGNLASLRALNDLIAGSGSDEGPLPMTRFRPNIVVDGGAAWDEDGWSGREVDIGEVRFRVIRSVSRCVVTTTDQESGDRGHEPLRALGRHRNVDQRLLFCTNLVPQTSGTVRMGDALSTVE